MTQNKKQRSTSRRRREEDDKEIDKKTCNKYPSVDQRLIRLYSNCVFVLYLTASHVLPFCFQHMFYIPETIVYFLFVCCISFAHAQTEKKSVLGQVRRYLLLGKHGGLKNL